MMIKLQRKAHWYWIGAITALALIVQVGHFSEHIIQLYKLITGFTHMPYMTPIAMDISSWFGETFFAYKPDPKQAYLSGMELLHLIGNAVFLLGCGGVLWLYKSRAAKWAFWLQALHVCEHICLTYTQIQFGQPLGISTLFGALQPNGLITYDPSVLVHYRVWWHFIFNAMSSFLIIWVLIRQRPYINTEAT